MSDRQLYHAQLMHSRKRHIEFLLTFEEWKKIWDDSGHWNERGTKKGQYCMARFNDEGPYAVGNVKIILHEENVIECNIRRNWAFNRIGKKQSAETREKIKRANVGQKRKTLASVPDDIIRKFYGEVNNVR